MGANEMASTMKWVKVSDDEYKGSTGYSEYRILRKAARLTNPNTSIYIFHGYKAAKYIAQGRDLEETQTQITAWIKKHS